MSLISRFLTGVYEVTRTGAGKYVGGFYEPGSSETVRMAGSLQPVSGRDAKMPEEGARLSQRFKFYSDQPLLPIGTKTLSKADVVRVNGETFKVISTELWQGVDLPYYKSVLQREPEQ